MSHRGIHFVVENTRIYSLPAQAPPLLVAAAGPKSAEMAAKLGDGLIATEPDNDLVKRFRKNGGSGKPVYGEIHVCFDEDQQHAEELAHEIWPVAALAGQLLPEIPLPSLFEKAADLVTREKVARLLLVGQIRNGI